MKKKLVILYSCAMLALPMSANANSLLPINVATLFTVTVSNFGAKAANAAQRVLDDLVANNGNGIKPSTLWDVCREGGIDIVTQLGKQKCINVFDDLIKGIKEKNESTVVNTTAPVTTTVKKGVEPDVKRFEKLDYVDSEPQLLAVPEYKTPSIDIIKAPVHTNTEILEYQLAQQKQINEDIEKQAKEAEKLAKEQAKEAEKQAKEAQKAAEEAAYYATLEGQLEQQRKLNAEIEKQQKEAQKAAEKQAKEAEKLAKEQAKEAEKLAKEQAKEAEKQAKLAAQLAAEKAKTETLLAGGHVQTKIEQQRENRMARRENNKNERLAQKAAKEQERQDELAKQLAAEKAKTEALLGNKPVEMLVENLESQ